MKTDYSTDTLILGATFYGCGLASAIKNSLLVDSSISVGSDYAFAFLQGKNWSQPLVCAASEEFRQELIARYALEDDRLLPAALAPVLAAWCIKRQIQPLLGLEFIRKSGKVYTFIDWGGNEINIEAEKVIDARCNGGKKIFTAAVFSGKILPEGKYGAFELFRTPAEKIYTLEMPCNADDDPFIVRKKLHEVWTERPAVLAEAQIIWSASRISSPVFANAAAALEPGCKDALNMLKFPILRFRKRVSLIAWSPVWVLRGSSLPSPPPGGEPKYWQSKKTSTRAVSGPGDLLPDRTFRMWAELPKFCRITRKNIPVITP